MTFPDTLSRADRARVTDMLNEVNEWDRQLRAPMRDIAQSMIDDPTLLGLDGREDIWYQQLIERMDAAGLPANPIANPPVRDLSSGSNCGGPHGQRFPDNYGIFCQVPPSDMPTRFKWPGFWTSGDSISCYFNSVQVTEAGAPAWWMSTPNAWSWNEATHQKTRDLHVLFGRPGNQYVMEPGDDWACVLVMIYW